MRKLGIDYGDSRVGIAITDLLGITVQGLETINHKGNDKIVLKRLEEIFRTIWNRHNSYRNANKYGWNKNRKMPNNRKIYP